MNNVKIGGIIMAAFIAGAFVASPDLRAYAANTVGSADIINESILSDDIKNGEVKSSEIAGSAVTNSKIGIGAVTNSKLGTSAVTSSKIQDGAIQTQDLANGAVTTGKLASNVFDGLQNQVDDLQASVDGIDLSNLDAAVSSRATSTDVIDVVDAAMDLINAHTDESLESLVILQPEKARSLKITETIQPVDIGGIGLLDRTVLAEEPGKTHSGHMSGRIILPDTNNVVVECWVGDPSEPVEVVLLFSGSTNQNGVQFNTDFACNSIVFSVSNSNPETDDPATLYLTIQYTTSTDDN